MIELQQHLTIRVRVIVFCAGHVLAVRDIRTGHWFLPGGGLEHGESAIACLQREIAEECDLVLTSEPKFFGVLENRFIWEGRDIHEMLLHFRASLANSPPPVVQSREAHLEFAWLALSRVQETTIWPPESQAAIAAAAAEPDIIHYAPLSGDIA